MFQSLRDNKKLLMHGLKIIPIAYLSFEIYTRIRNWQIQNHPSLEAVEMIIRLDPRITKFCGKNYQIKPNRYYEEDNKRCTYRLRVSGIRGDCKVLVKLEKDTHGYLSNIMKDQINYSKSTKEQKLKDPFTPINFNDIFIPTKETQKKIEENLNKDFLIFNKEDYLSGKYYDKEYVKGINANNNNNATAVSTKISKNDTLYRINSIIMVANDSLVFNIRPIGPKFRNYDIEDTYYTFKTYNDIIKRLHDYRYRYNEVIANEISPEELRNDLIQQKQTNFEKRIQTRRFVMMANVAVIFFGYMAIKMLLSHNIDLTAVNTISNTLINNPKLKSSYGNHRLVAVAYKFNPFDWSYNLSGFIMGTGKFGKLSGKVEVKDKLYYKNLKLYTIEENNSFKLI
jgi:hypothetical protein